MNKTININLAGLFFHIDEDAFNKLQKYLGAVRRSFSGMQGSEEIMADIESRVAELFLEKRANDQQVISIIHVDEVISIMGQPEDYEVDEEIFEGERKSSAQQLNNRFNKPLFRDTLNGYIGGVCSGLGHFLGIDAIWVRLFFVLISFVTFPFNVLAYFIFWIIAKDAVTTNQRLQMIGKEVNISNLGKNFKSGFDDVVDGQTDADYRIVGQKGKRGTVRFFGFLGRLIKGIFKAIAKIIGLFMFLLGSTLLIAVVLGIIGLGTIQFQGNNFFNLIEYAIPENISLVWVYIISLCLMGIPALILAILGLKLLVNKMGSIGRPAKIILLLLWIGSVIGLCIIIASVGASSAFEGKITSSEDLVIDSNKVYEINMTDSSYEGYDNIRINGNKLSLSFDEDGKEQFKLFGIKTAIATSKDSIGKLQVTYLARGANMAIAKSNASTIEYPFTITDNSIILPDFFTINQKRLTQQEIMLIIRLPEGTKFKWNEEFEYHYYSEISRDVVFLESKDIESDQTYIMENGKAVCLDCPIIEETEDETPEIGNEPTRSNSDDDTNWKYEDDVTTKTKVTKSSRIGTIKYKVEETY